METYDPQCFNRARHLNDDGDALVKLREVKELYDQVLQCNDLVQLLIGLNFTLPFTNCNTYLQFKKQYVSLWVLKTRFLEWLSLVSHPRKRKRSKSLLLWDKTWLPCMFFRPKIFKMSKQERSWPRLFYFIYLFLFNYLFSLGFGINYSYFDDWLMLRITEELIQKLLCWSKETFK